MKLFSNLPARAKRSFEELEDRHDVILADGMRAMATTAISRCVDPEVAASIHTVGPVTDKRDRRTVLVIAGNESTVDIGDDGKRYQRARQVEFGTRHIPAKPFMRPAYRDHITKTRRQISAANRAFIKRLFNAL